MGFETGIEWCDHTFNPWWGCVEVSPACDHCYARSFARRCGHEVWGKDAPRRIFQPSHFHDLKRWNAAAELAGQRRRVFPGSMCDLMENRRDLDPSRELLWDAILDTPWLTYLLLTKRPQNFRRLLPDEWVIDGCPDNVWLLTTVESDEYRWRIRELEQIPAVVHGLSCEPLLGLLNLDGFLGNIQWVIGGGESGPGARPMQVEWARSLRDQCQRAQVPFFFKQWGEWWPMTRTDGIHESPFGGQHLIRVGKKNAGNALDGVQWAQFPEPVTT